MIETIKQATLYPFYKDGYKKFLALSKKQVLNTVIVFLAIQFLITLVIPSLFLPRKITTAWNNGKSELTAYIRSLDFSYIGVNAEGYLVTDLADQPYVVSEEGTRETSMLIIDSTGTVTESALYTKNARRVSGILVLKDRVVTKNTNGEMRTMRYAEYTNGEPVTFTKTQMLDGLKNNVIEDAIKEFAVRPTTILVLIFALIVVLIFVIIASVLNIVVWSAIVAGIAYLLTKNTGLKRYMSAFKLSLLAYFASWYVKTLASYFDLPGGLPSLIKWATLFFLISIVAITLSDVKMKKDETEKEEVKAQ